jgi:hypothetical protein
MEILVVSSGRPLKQTTFDNFPKELRERARLLVPQDEVSDYKKYPVIPCPTFGIGKTRQWVIENVEDKVVMLDDDLVFSHRRSDNPTKFRNATDGEIMRLFEMISQKLDDYPHVGVATREGGNRNIYTHIFNTRMLRVLAYRAATLRSEGVRFDRLPVMEDFDVTLQLLRKGYPNVVINTMVHNQNGSGLIGGCSQYRTMQLQADGAMGLKNLHPDYVRIVKKQTKTAWNGEERTDVVIAWKKSYRSDGPGK